jgi:hypothetical protein
MTEQEVEDILGGPPGDYRRGPTSNPFVGKSWSRGWGTGEPGMKKSWLGDDLFVHVFFNQDGRVSGVFFVEVWHPE